MADILVEAGATIIADEDRMAKLLCTIGFKNELTKLKYLVKCEVDLEVGDYDKRTLGHLAGAEGHIEILEYLAINTRFNFNIADRFGTKVIDEIENLAEKRRISDLINQRGQKFWRNK